ncbi:MAG: choline dehydrogenase [Gammaproteobacteria bacterium]
MVQSHFDYIVVGGGTAGCVLAGRLTEDPSNRVLVLEAGPKYRGLSIQVPGAVASLYQKGRYHWGYQSEPEIYANNQKLPYKMGYVLGGSSAINGMVWVRGNPTDYDSWASDGCPGWSYQEIEPIFRRIESFDEPSDVYMGQHGPINIVRGDPSSSPLNQAFLAAVKQAGYPLNNNCNGPSQEGFGPLHRNIWRGRRSDAYAGYLTPALKRPNLTILTGAQVQRIVVENNRAIGVDYRNGKTQHRIFSDQEILLAAGSLGSPQLLQLSGIGEPTLLESFGIPVVLDLPGVGYNLQTHPLISFAFECKEPVGIYPETRFPRKWLAGLKWLLTHTGSAATTHIDVGGFIRSDPSLYSPDIQFSFAPIVFGDLYNNFSGHGFQIWSQLVNCKSRGYVRICSPNAKDHPQFRFNFFRDTRDITALQFSCDLIRRIANQPAFVDLCGREIRPGKLISSDFDFRRWIRETASVTHHLAGSCRMGSVDKPLTVVAPDLKVHGVKGLRVVDASIMPKVTTGNTHAPVIMIAEKAVDIIQNGSANNL